MEEFQLLSRQTEDVFMEVRLDILNQLYQGLKEVSRLPLRFLSLLVLYATDPDREILVKVNKVRKEKEIIKYRE